jgi:hypothetical protein
MMNVINKFFRIFFVMLQKIITAIFALFALGSSANAQQGSTIELHAGLYKIQAEVAKTEKARQLGLMHRTYMPADEGMLFIF